MSVSQTSDCLGKNFSHTQILSRRLRASSVFHPHTEHRILPRQSMCSVDSEKAFNCVPRNILLGCFRSIEYLAQC